MLEQSLITSGGDRIVCTLQYHYYSDRVLYQVIRWALNGEWVLPVTRDGRVTDAEDIVRLNQYHFKAEDLESINALRRRVQSYLVLMGGKPGVYEVRSAPQIDNKAVG